MLNIRILLMVLFLGVLPGAGQTAWSEIAEEESKATPAVDSNQTEETESWMSEEYNSSFDNEGPDTGLVKRFVYVVSMVIALGVGAYYFSKKLVPKLTTSQGRNISVVETVHLGAQKTLHLIKVGEGRKLLIASGGQSINLLADVTEDFEEKVQGETL
ncbi:MAG: hypothetical protein E4H40_04200 [Candidatus Brocadiia bacterium]|nr:MAG: hypothetical protein E4H40_04200 [Candidatus Brocadiia bacterium]